MWTNAFPSKPGYYWLKPETTDKASVVEVVARTSFFEVEFFVAWHGMNSEQPVKFYENSIWYGPIEPPAT